MSGSGTDEARTGDGAPAGGPRRRRVLPGLGIALLILAVPVGGTVWLFQDELFHPFGDSRACEGSEVPLSDVVGAADAAIPEDATDIHHVTRNGSAQVTFVSRRMPDFLHRTGLVPYGTSVFASRYRSKYALVDGETELPAGLCGSGVRGPVMTYGGSSVSVMVERSPFNEESFRRPARALVTYRTP
ncbi:hypothetical protein AB0I86_12290 [Streptomyces sp. NPDC049950]|uniref:hypothetical protein n=1 Tax=Streptomyces TaxID=1883 RepID=UPI0004BE3AA2|nr:hypothetical protein [[Kitasatospora] papulosa]